MPAGHCPNCPTAHLGHEHAQDPARVRVHGALLWTQMRFGVGSQTLHPDGRIARPYARGRRLPDNIEAVEHDVQMFTTALSG